MVATLEITNLNQKFPFRIFWDDGLLGYPGHHWHKELEIIYIQKGTLKFGVEKEVIELEEGEFYLINSGDVHFFLSSPNSLRIAIQFDFSMISSSILPQDDHDTMMRLFNRIPKSSVMWRQDDKDKVVELIQKMSHEMILKQVGYELAIKARLLDLFLFILREIPKEENTNPNLEIKVYYLNKIKSVYEYVEKNYIEQISLNDVAEHVGFAPTYFSKFFKKHAGITFLTHLNQFRIGKAQWLLYNEDLSISEISNRVGFSNIKTFNRLFKSQLGVSPSQFKKDKF